MKPIAILASAKPLAEPRSEQFWLAALKRANRAAYYVTNLNPIAPGDIVLAAKPSLPDVQRLAARGCPVVIWIMDQVDYNPGRLTWFQRILPYVKGVALAEPPETYNLELPAIQLMGSSRTPSEALGIKPTIFPPPDVYPNPVFLTQYETPERREICQAIVDAGLPLDVYGCKTLPATNHYPAIWNREGHQLLRRAPIVLSISNRHDRKMTSNRLFNAAAMGACIVAKEFPGCREIFPQGVFWASKPRQFAGLIAELLAPEFQFRLPIFNITHGELRALARETVQEHFWAHHSWDKRIEVLLEWMKGLEL